MPWWFWLGWSVPLALWFWRLSFRALVNDCGSRHFDGSDFAMCFVFATFGFWLIGPGAVFLGTMRRVFRPDDWHGLARTIAGRSSEERREDRRTRKDARASRLRELERRNAELEGQLGIGQ